MKKYKYKSHNQLFKILCRVNPLIALGGTFALSNNWLIGWYILMLYNLLNIYVYLKRRKDFIVYALISCLHFSFGLWAIFIRG